MDFSGKKVRVYGAGKSGSGAVNLLVKLGAHPVLFDEKPGLTGEQMLAGVDEPGEVTVCAGTLPENIAHALDLIVMSPGVPVDLPRVRAWKEAGLPVIGEVELAYRAGHGRVLAVTGTNGKTTTTSLLGDIMRAAVPEVFVVGNIGNAYTGAALRTTERSTVVAEISSFQLETIDTFRPDVSAILNITEDHMNRHHTMEEYIRVKEMITKNQDRTNTCVLNYEDPVLREFAAGCPAKVRFFSSKHTLDEGVYLDGNEIVIAEHGRKTPVVDVTALKLIGMHNYENVMAAVAMAASAGVDLNLIADTARRFRPVEHRIEYVDEKRGVIWYNDSKGTNPDAAIRGIEAMSRPTLLIAGGYDKQSDYDPWIRSFGGRVKKLVLEGATKDNIRVSAVALGFPEEDIVMCGNMHEAMDYCRDHAEEGDAVLLSPACASWGEFPNYEVRGDVFKEYVRKEV